jgi:hypothetical protein
MYYYFWEPVPDTSIAATKICLIYTVHNINTAGLCTLITLELTLEIKRNDRLKFIMSIYK